MRPHAQALGGVHDLVREPLVVRVVGPEHQVLQTAVGVDHREAVQPLVPQPGVGLGERGVGTDRGQVGDGRHPAADRFGQVVALGVEVPGGHQAEQPTGGGPVMGDGGGAVPGAAHDVDQRTEAVAGADVGVAGDESGLEVLHLADRRHLVVDRLVVVQKTQSAVARERDGEFRGADGLHDRRGERGVQLDRRRLTVDVPHQGCAQIDRRRRTVDPGPIRQEQKLVERPRDLGDDLCHSFLLTRRPGPGCPGRDERPRVPGPGQAGVGKAGVEVPHTAAEP